MPRFRFFDTPLQTLMRELPFRALLPLALAVFALFSILGPVTDLLDGAGKPPLSAVRNGVLSGLFALGYGYGAMRRNWPVLWLTGATQFAWIAGTLLATTESPSLAPGEVAVRLKVDGLWVLASMITSYTCFLWFIKATATRYLRVRAEIELAHQIHQVLVPPIAETHGEFEFAGLSIASGEVGGDLVDVVTLSSNTALPPPGGSEHGWFGYVADVSGHGVSSGVVMGMFKSALRMRLLHPGPLSALLEDLNAVLLPLTSSSMFVTVACIRCGTGGTLEYCVAGHLPILRVRAGTAEARDIEELSTPQIPIGMFEDYRFTSATLECGRGDVLALITDGLTEVFDATDEQFGMDAVKAILGRLAGRPLAEISQAIVSAARAHGTQIDDQTLLLIRRRSV